MAKESSDERAMQGNIALEEAGSKMEILGRRGSYM